MTSWQADSVPQGHCPWLCDSRGWQHCWMHFNSVSAAGSSFFDLQGSVDVVVCLNANLELEEHRKCRQTIWRRIICTSTHRHVGRWSLINSAWAVWVTEAAESVTTAAGLQDNCRWDAVEVQDSADEHNCFVPIYHLWVAMHDLFRHPQSQ